jgi:hypothetical protein
LLRAAEPGFLIFGGLGVIVHADIGNGLDTAACVAARWSLLPDLLAIAALERHLREPR